MTRKQPQQRRCGAVRSQEHMDQQDEANALAASAGNAAKVQRGLTTDDVRTHEPGCLQCPKDGAKATETHIGRVYALGSELTQEERDAEQFGATYTVQTGQALTPEEAKRQADRDALSAVHAILVMGRPLTTEQEVEVFNLLLTTSPYADHFKAVLDPSSPTGWDFEYGKIEATEHAKARIEAGAFGGQWPVVTESFIGATMDEDDRVAFTKIAGSTSRYDDDRKTFRPAISLDPGNAALYTPHAFKLLRKIGLKLIPDAGLEIEVVANGLQYNAARIDKAAQIAAMMVRPGIGGTVQGLVNLISAQHELAELSAAAAEIVLSIILSHLDDPETAKPYTGCAGVTIR